MPTEIRGRILWVDDEIELLKPHILYLEERGYEVDQVTNGRDAVSAVRETDFDLVLLDEMMPGMDGIATLKGIKDVRPSLDVIMITKSEEEWLMDEALAEKITDYLTKPVNPSQVFLACKKTLEGEQIIEEKAASTYLKEFKEIEAALSTDLTVDDWWSLYLKLVQWQLELDERKDLGLGSILDEQMKDANRKFARFIEERYAHWLHSSPEKRPTLSPDILPHVIVPDLASGGKIFLLVVDCLRLDQALTIMNQVGRYFKVKLDYHVSLLPSATPFSRNAIFSGRFLSEIQKRESAMWRTMTSSDQSMNRHESDLMAQTLSRSGLDNASTYYFKVNASREGASFVRRLREYQDTSLIALVVNFVDLLTHHRSESEILLEMMPDEAGYRSTVRTWFENSWLFEVLKTLREMPHRIILTTDHGSIRVHKGVRILGDSQTSTGVRYKYGRNLNCSGKHALVIKRPGDYFLPEMTTGTNYLVAKEDVYFVYPTEYHKYLKLYQGSFQHGGISMEEMLIPLFTLTPQ
ncbi:MAG: response regulator [Fidelibacterota bacterium]